MQASMYIEPKEPVSTTTASNEFVTYDYVYDPKNFVTPEKVRVCNKKRVPKAVKKRKQKLSQKSKVINRK